MPKLSRKARLIQEILGGRMTEEHYPEYVKWYNISFDILKQKTLYMVVDKRDASLIKVYTGLETAHKHIVLSIN